MKIGLVLAGGGAKGAYQVGVLRALDEAGIRPAVIAGTSIGAFNAVLTLINSQEREAIWQNLATSHFSRARWSITLLAIAIRLAKFWVFVVRSPDRYKLPFISSLFARTLSPSRGIALFFLFFTCGLILAIKFGFLADGTPPSKSLLLVLLFGVLGLFLALDMIVLFIDRLETRGLSGITGLANIVRNSIPWERLKSSEVQIFVTLGTKVPGSFVWAPEYVRVNALNNLEAFRVFVSTMALPLIFSKVVVNGVAYYDGGMGDNTPIFALAKLDCDRIYVVHLNRFATVRCLWVPTMTWRLNDRKELRGWFIHLIAAQRQAGKPIDEDLFEKEWRARWASTEIVHIHPTDKLAWWPHNTIFFSQERCRKWIELGYNDAQGKLKPQSAPEALRAPDVLPS
jgi:predicted acylesterase/phospholipase RssA